MSKWVRFTRRFNFQPQKKAAVTIQHDDGDVDDVTNEHADRAIEKGAAVLINPPANADEAAKLRSGETKPVDAPVAKAAPAAAPKT